MNKSETAKDCQQNRCTNANMNGNQFKGHRPQNASATEAKTENHSKKRNSIWMCWMSVATVRWLLGTDKLRPSYHFHEAHMHSNGISFSITFIRAAEFLHEQRISLVRWLPLSLRTICRCVQWCGGCPHIDKDLQIILTIDDDKYSSIRLIYVVVRFKRKLWRREIEKLSDQIWMVLASCCGRLTDASITLRFKMKPNGKKKNIKIRYENSIIFFLFFRKYALSRKWDRYCRVPPL